jgi:hypothetical protein
MIKRIVLFVLSLLLIVSFPSYAQNVATATQSELETIYTKIVSDPPNSFTPNTLEHKASRWAQYKEEKGSYPYERWSNTYNSNMTKATKAKEIELAYMKSLGWGEAQKSVKVGDRTRRLDIAEADPKKPPNRAVEVKAYETGTVYATAEIIKEVEMDDLLGKSVSKWKIEWHFLGCKPSAPLRTLLQGANIPIKEVP